MLLINYSQSDLQSFNNIVNIFLKLICIDMHLPVVIQNVYEICSALGGLSMQAAADVIDTARVWRIKMQSAVHCDAF
jgi:hypothetical protein